MKKKLFILAGLMVMVLVPMLAMADDVGVNIANSTLSADACAGLNNLGKLICNIHVLLNSIIPVLLALGVVYFVWGVVQFVIANDEEAKTKGRERIIYGIIGFAVILGMWSLVSVVVKTFGLEGVQLNAPTFVPVSGAPDEGTCTMGENFQGLLKFGTCIINNSIIPFLFAVAILMFIWGAIKFFIINSDEESKREQGKQFMIWGIIALAVMTAIWGLVGILTNTFFNKNPILPQVCPPGSEQCK